MFDKDIFEEEIVKLLDSLELRHQEHIKNHAKELKNKINQYLKVLESEDKFWGLRVSMRYLTTMAGYKNFWIEALINAISDLMLDVGIDGEGKEHGKNKETN